MLAIEGEVDLVTGGRFRAALERAGSPDVLVVDLREVSFLGSVGVSHLLEASARVGAGVLRVVPGGASRRTIDVAGLAAVLIMYDSVEDALSVTR